MICRYCGGCSKGYFKSKPKEYVCIAVRHPFIIKDIDAECTVYDYKELDCGKEKNMGNEQFIELCKSYVKQYIEKHIDATDKMPEFEVYVVWACKTLQNNKAILSTTISDGMVYEFTYNGDKNELYVDVYKKWENICECNVLK